MSIGINPTFPITRQTLFHCVLISVSVGTRQKSSITTSQIFLDVKSFVFSLTFTNIRARQSILTHACRAIGLVGLRQTVLSELVFTVNNCEVVIPGECDVL